MAIERIRVKIVRVVEVERVWAEGMDLDPACWCCLCGWFS